MRKAILAFIFSLCGVFFLSTAVHAGTVGIVKGLVTDPDGAVVVGMAVQLYDSTNTQIDYATTNDSGYFNFYSRSDGDYSITFTPSLSYTCSACSLFSQQTDAITVDSTQAVFDSSVSATVQDLGTYQMEQATRYATVHVEDQNGDPVVGEYVSGWSEDGWANGATDSNGEYQFAVTEGSTAKWFLSVYPVTGYTSAYQHDVEMEATGETLITLVVQRTDATIVATLKDTDGNTVTLTNEQYGSVNCYDPESYSSYFFGSITGGNSSATISLLAGTYRCEAWVDGYGAESQEVTVGSDETVEIDITLLEYSATINFRYVDSSGDTIADIGSFSAFGSTIADPDGNEYYNGYVHAQGENGEATLEVLDGYTYQIGGWIDNSTSGSGGGGEGSFGGDEGSGDSGGHEGEDSGGEGSFGGDEGSFEGDEGDFSGDEGEFGGDEGDFSGGFGHQGLHTTAEGAQYIQNYDMTEVTGDEDEAQTVEVVLQSADATIEVTVLDENGEPAQYAWVSAMEADVMDDFKHASKESDEHEGGWGTYVGGSADENGVASLAVASGKAYELFAFTANAFNGDVLPPPRQTATPAKDETVSVTMQSRMADWTVNLQPETDTDADLDHVFCYGYSPDLGVENFTEASDGSGTMGLVRGTDWYIGCMGYAADNFFRASDVFYTPGDEEDGSEDLTITMTEAGEYYGETSYTASATSSSTITLPDGESTLTIPANSIADSGNVTVTISTATDYKVSDDNFPLEAFEFSVIDGDGNEVTEFSSNLTLNLAYNEEDLEQYGINEADLTGGAYNESTKSWESPVSTTVDVETNQLSIVLNHFSSYGSLGDKGLSTVEVVAPNKIKASSLKAKKIKKHSAVISWKKPSGTVTTYVLQVKKKGAKKSKWMKFNSITALKKKASSLKAGTVYQFRAKACNTDVCSNFTKWKSFTTLANE